LKWTGPGTGLRACPSLCGRCAMPEGDTIFRTAQSLGAVLTGEKISRARSSALGQAIARVEGSTVEAVQAKGKHLIIGFDNGLALHTHMRLQGSWHRYRRGERWRRPAWKARAVLETADWLAVCFDAPVVELVEQRALRIHPALAALGPDLLAADFDLDEAIRRLRDPARQGKSVAEALLDQRALAGIGNVYKNETLFLERANPWRAIADIPDERLVLIVERARALLGANTGGGVRTTTGRSSLAAGSRLWVYRRAGRPCFRCGTRIVSRRQGEEARITFWCPACQA
jgi:endonuclease VIII